MRFDEPRGNVMQNTTTTRAKGKLKELSGKAKAGVGKLIGNEQMQLEGKAQATGSKTRQAAAKAGERLQGGAEEFGGTVKKGIGRAVEDKEMEAEGSKEERKGKARQRASE
jgi:uncharacterized protein YjbJ (UPF0337 family)